MNVVAMNNKLDNFYLQKKKKEKENNMKKKGGNCIVYISLNVVKNMNILIGSIILLLCQKLLL